MGREGGAKHCWQDRTGRERLSGRLQHLCMARRRRRDREMLAGLPVERSASVAGNVWLLHVGV